MKDKRAADFSDLSEQATASAKSKSIEDYVDPELSHLLREYLERKHFPAEKIGKIQVQVTFKKCRI